MPSQFPRAVWVDQDLTLFSVILLCDDSTGCDEVDDFTTEADTMLIDIAYEDDLN